MSGEYFVLDGALGLALPCRFGQSLNYQSGSEKNILHWRSLDDNGTLWFEGRYLLDYLSYRDGSDDEIGEQLLKILKAAQRTNPRFLSQTSLEVETKLSFPRDWGLGSSSTLIYAIAQWANIDPFNLQFETMGGSAYDIACAGSDGPLLYKKENGPVVRPVDFNPTFKEQLSFVYLGKKQDSRAGIQYYREQLIHKENLVKEITALSMEMAQAKDLRTFELAILEHEAIVSENLKLDKVKDLFFKDFWGTVKSLGAWGGDFVLVTSDVDYDFTQAYFEEKGFDTFLTYDQMVF